MITAIAAAFGGVSGAGGESGQIYAGVNTAVGGFGLGANPGDGQPAAYMNYILFDKNYNVVDMGWTIVPSQDHTQQKITIPTIRIKEAGYIFVYLSYEDESNNYVEFDDFKVTYTPSKVLQYNEYYPFGLQTANSWTRDNATNSFLYDAGNELNANSGWYETFFRGYDPALGRFHQVDPLADNYSSHTPYNYANNDPVYWSDPSGAYGTAWSRDLQDSYLGGDYGTRRGNFLELQWAYSHGTPDPWGNNDLYGDVVGDLGLSDMGYGFGSLYANPSTIADAQQGESNALKWVTVNGQTPKAGVVYGDSGAGESAVDYTLPKYRGGGPSLTIEEVLKQKAAKVTSVDPEPVWQGRGGPLEFDFQGRPEDSDPLLRFTPALFQFGNVTSNWKAVGLKGASVGFISYASGVPVPVGVFFELEVGVPNRGSDGTYYTDSYSQIQAADAANRAGEYVLGNKALFKNPFADTFIPRLFAKQMQIYLNERIRGALVNTPIITPGITEVNAITGQIFRK